MPKMKTKKSCGAPDQDHGHRQGDGVQEWQAPPEHRQERPDISSKGKGFVLAKSEWARMKGMLPGGK